MSIDDHFKQIDLLFNNPLIKNSKIIKEKRSLRIALINGKCILIDNSEFHFMEFIDTHNKSIVRSYRYHFQDNTGKLIFRYDCAPHYPELQTFPHHKHLGSTVIESRQKSIIEIFKEVILEVERNY